MAYRTMFATFSIDPPLFSTRSILRVKYQHSPSLTGAVLVGLLAEGCCGEGVKDLTSWLEGWNQEPSLGRDCESAEQTEHKARWGKIGVPSHASKCNVLAMHI